MKKILLFIFFLISLSSFAQTSCDSLSVKCFKFKTYVSQPQTLSDSTMYILINWSDENGILNLPVANANNGREYVIKLIHATGTVVITPSGTDKIDGAETKILSVQYKFIKIKSDNINWLIISEN